MITREGIFTTREWLIKKFAEGKMMYAANRIRIRYPDKTIKIKFGDKFDN
jgi:hypothetical protein